MIGFLCVLLGVSLAFIVGAYAVCFWMCAGDD